jgi:hypothetical protein
VVPAAQAVFRKALCGQRAKILSGNAASSITSSEESYAEKWNSVRDNPVRAGLVKTAHDWPYAGEIVSLVFL